MENNKYYKFSDGWFEFYVNVADGTRKLKLDEGDIEVERERDDFHRKPPRVRS